MIYYIYLCMKRKAYLILWLYRELYRILTDAGEWCLLLRVFIHSKANHCCWSVFVKSGNWFCIGALIICSRSDCQYSCNNQCNFGDCHGSLDLLISSQLPSLYIWPVSWLKWPVEILLLYCWWQFSFQSKLRGKSSAQKFIQSQLSFVYQKEYCETWLQYFSVKELDIGLLSIYFHMSVMYFRCGGQSRWWYSWFVSWSNWRPCHRVIGQRSELLPSQDVKNTSPTVQI